MISKLCSKAYRRYISLPILGSILAEFTIWSYQRGYSKDRIKGHLSDATRIDCFFRQHGIRKLQNLTHLSFDTAWHYYRHSRPNTAGTIRQIEHFLDETRGLQPISAKPLSPTKCELKRFADNLQDAHGFTISTIKSYTRYLQDFLEYIGYDTNLKSLTDLTSKQIEGFIYSCSKRLNRHSLQHVVGYLRRFLRYQYDQSVLAKPLHMEIDTPRVYRSEKLPRDLPWETVTAFLHSIDRTTPHEIRDYTIFYLIITYGLRPCEIVSLTLDDIDWQKGILRVSQCKTANILLLPLTDPVGEILIEYLRKSRPNNLPYSELFLRVRAPHGTLKPTAITEAFQLRVRRSKLNIPYHGPYCLRHSYAVHLLREGTSLKTIGDLLGHRSTESTCAYLRLNNEDLRTVALPAPQENSLNTPSDIIEPSKYQPKHVRRKKTAGLSNRSDPHLQSFLKKDIRDYIKLYRSLGRCYTHEMASLASFDHFIAEKYPAEIDLKGEMFNKWSTITLSHLSSTSKRYRMLCIRKFCLYRARSHTGSFVPDLQTFPAKNEPTTPYIFSESEIGCLLNATQYLRHCEQSPVRPQTIRIAIMLLYTTGIRRGELLRLGLGDYNSTDKTLLINNTKFHKSRIIPLSPSVVEELEYYLELRTSKHLQMNKTAPLVLHGYAGSEGSGYSGTAFRRIWVALCGALGIYTDADAGRHPRIHDIRHSFAVNVLQQWYRTGENVQAKLPLLSTYMGHISINSTAYYLSFVEGLRSESNTRFQDSFGNVITVADFGWKKPAQNNGGVQ